ncbi:unnamed protein product [Schistosoma curassoni]|uniref:DUF4806 domain-containing protein n=1 Tax=Schistosoma curassoni TaxID=6186 RepID=A0A183KS44_9TREM|nr:unnamed protein product [Schistosoma curassoni]
MTSNKHYDSDEIPELSPHYSGVYDEDQLGKNKLKNNSMIELEIARLRITQLEKEIELEKLRCPRCEGFGQSASNSENTILKNLYLPKREVMRFDDISFPRVEDENAELLIGCNAPSVHEMKEVRTGKSNEPFPVKTLLGWTLFGSYGEPCKSNRVLNHLSAKEELEDKFEQSYSTEFKNRLSRTSSMSVEDRIASS